MTEELGFRTPEKELQALRKRVEQMEGLGTATIDSLKLSVLVLIEIFAERAASKPKNARAIKDAMLANMKQLEISRELQDALDTGLRAACDKVDEYLRRKSG